VVTFAAGGMPEMVSNGEDGVLVSPFDQLAFGTALTQLRDDRDLVRALGAAAQQRYVHDNLVPPEEQFVAALESL
jgi:glycosyltransferase involved in cell wall biosynthesis